jgi:hypothetical protein
MVHIHHLCVGSIRRRRGLFHIPIHGSAVIGFVTYHGMVSSLPGFEQHSKANSAAQNIVCFSHKEPISYTTAKEQARAK